MKSRIFGSANFRRQLCSRPGKLLGGNILSQRDVMTQPLEQIVRRKLSDEVFDRLERMITSGELQPGDEMPSERVLMERFGVGRPAIREAMQSLANKGLV